MTKVGQIIQGEIDDAYNRGRREALVEIVKNLLGALSPQEISKRLGLTMDKVERIANDSDVERN